MTWLLTGGAGYIGAHVVRSLQAAGHGVVVVDDLSSGVRRKLPADVTLVEAAVSDTATLVRTMTACGVTGVVHLAAKKAVGESVERPLHYYRENVDGASPSPRRWCRPACATSCTPPPPPSTARSTSS